MLQLTENKQQRPILIENFEPNRCARKSAQKVETRTRVSSVDTPKRRHRAGEPAQKVEMRSPAERPLGFWAGLQGHGDEGAHEDGGEKLADDGLCDGERAGEWIYGVDVAAEGRQRRKTVVGELRGEL